MSTDVLTPTVPTVEEDRRVQALTAAYARCLDTDRLEDWPHFFTEDGLYKVLSRENVELGLPAPLIYYYSRGMMQDRITAIRDALTYEPVYTRHLVSGLSIERMDNATYAARSDFAIYQSTEEGVTRLFCVGEYQDRIITTSDGLRFQERVVVVDTFGIQNLIAVPL